MSLTNAILTGLSGIDSNQVSVATIGNNVANVNTTGFKSSRTLFETQYVRTIKAGTPPTDTSGGTNPSQVGYGSTVANIQRSFAQGTNQRTGVAADLAIDGGGFFVLQTPENDQVFTRAGAFSLNTDNRLVAADGSFVQGFEASEDGTIDTGNLTGLQIPVGVVTEAGATTEARMVGNLNASSELAVSGAVVSTAPMTIAGGAAATAVTPLTGLLDSAGDPLFADADVISIAGIQKGGIDLPDAQFAVGINGSTFGDLAAFLETALGIDTSGDAIGTPGVIIGDGVTAPAGALVVKSNAGDVNAINIDSTSIRNTTSGVTPFTFTATPGTGEGVTTSFKIFDSLGTPVDLRIRAVQESKDDTGTAWRFTVESVDDTNPSALLGGGAVRFDSNGRFVAATGTELSLARGQTGAVTPLTFRLDLSDLNNLTSPDGESTFQMASQDGFPAGTLTDYEIDGQGIITGTFDNSQQRVFGQVALATFVNDQGLVGQSLNTYAVGVNSGAPMIGAPGAGSAGRIESGQLEQSNVDLSRELINLITASTGFSAASRTIRTADDMLQELMLLVR